MSSLLPTIRSLSNMVSEMDRKGLDAKRISKTASLLIMSGLSRNSISERVVERILNAQGADGGWAANVDTMWNTCFLSLLDRDEYGGNVRKGLDFLLANRTSDGLWGRSKRDMSRIPVSGVLLYLFPKVANRQRLRALEELWLTEKNSLTYKTGYTLAAFAKNEYKSNDKSLVRHAVTWLIAEQRPDGGFAPWRDHPVDSNVFCTSIAVLGLLSYPDLVPEKVFAKARGWLYRTRLQNGIWPYHEIEDGASWGLYALSKLDRQQR